MKKITKNPRKKNLSEAQNGLSLETRSSTEEETQDERKTGRADNHVDICICEHSKHDHYPGLGCQGNEDTCPCVEFILNSPQTKPDRVKSDNSRMKIAFDNESESTIRRDKTEDTTQQIKDEILNCKRCNVEIWDENNFLPKKDKFMFENFCMEHKTKIIRKQALEEVEKAIIEEIIFLKQILSECKRKPLDVRIIEEQISALRTIKSKIKELENDF